MTNNLLGIAIVIFTVLVVRWLERQQSATIQSLLRWLPAILFAYLIPAAITHGFSLDLTKITLHDVSRDWLIPLAVVMVMSALPLAKLRVVGARPLVLFIAGSLAIATLPVILVLLASHTDESYRVMFIDQSYWKGLVPIVGGWIGGSTSQLVLKEVSGTDEGLFLSVLVLDNILVNLWTILMFQMIRRSSKLNSMAGISDEIPTIDEDTDERAPLHPMLVATICLVAVTVAHLMQLVFLWKILSLSVVGLLLVNFLPRWNIGFVLRGGGIAIVVIMAILGLRLNFYSFSLPASFVVLVVTWLLLHYLFMLIVALLLRLNLAWLPIASMANLGGISTAPAVTAAYRRELMPHAILLAILSMVSGTAWGLLTIQLFRWMFPV